MAGINIVLYEPEIPSNTGNIGRTCVAAGARLHLIEPLGFQLNEKAIKRAGMDYWKELDVRRYGVIVTNGHRRGLLLPNLEGVDTVQEQIAIAKQKAGIRADEEVELQRFEVVRHGVS